MYVNSIELLFWPDHTKLAAWMNADSRNKDERDNIDPKGSRIVSSGPTYSEALKSILGQLKQQEIVLEDGLAEQMAEATAEKDGSDELIVDQVFLGIVANTVH